MNNDDLIKISVNKGNNTNNGNFNFTSSAYIAA